jgi:alkanesulfonate monooxygenase SsuD/methylene tetrahydromethanopterin reductase-like flavin-dependent oxidoreductase (luciferase family)
MSFGISLQTSPSLEALGDSDALSFVVERAREAEAAGVDDIWLNQGLDIDGITFAALVAREVPRVIVGIAVVPMYYHHPISIAGLAKAAQLAARGRFARGIGHRRQVHAPIFLSFPICLV